MVCFRCYSFGFMIIAQTAAFRYSHPSKPENIIVFIFSLLLFPFSFIFRCFFYVVVAFVASPLHSIEDGVYSKKKQRKKTQKFVLFWKFEMVMYHHLCLCVFLFFHIFFLSQFIFLQSSVFMLVCVLLCAILSVFSITPSFTLKTINPTTNKMPTRKFYVQEMNKTFHRVAKIL